MHHGIHTRQLQLKQSSERSVLIAEAMLHVALAAVQHIKPRSDALLHYIIAFLKHQIFAEGHGCQPPQNERFTQVHIPPIRQLHVLWLQTE